MSNFSTLLRRAKNAFRVLICLPSNYHAREGQNIQVPVCLNPEVCCVVDEGCIGFDSGSLGFDKHLEVFIEDKGCGEGEVGVLVVDEGCFDAGSQSSEEHVPEPAEDEDSSDVEVGSEVQPVDVDVEKLCQAFADLHLFTTCTHPATTQADMQVYFEELEAMYESMDKVLLGMDVVLGADVKPVARMTVANPDEMDEGVERPLIV